MRRVEKQNMHTERQRTGRNAGSKAGRKAGREAGRKAGREACREKEQAGIHFLHPMP